ncbi:MAG: rhlE 2 [Proteobacteria bacterium]|nr:rhlE 2 [Pseudomonadota bacterium]
MTETNLLPPKFEAWFASRGWNPRPHQLALLEHGLAGRSILLIAPTGAGKTLAGFLPSLVDLAARPKWKPGTRRRGVHTLYVSPLKALAVDIERNLETPVRGIGLDAEADPAGHPAHHARAIGAAARRP